MIRLTEGLLRCLGWKRVSLSLVLVNEAQIQQLNRRFMGENSPTDVLAFGQTQAPFLGPRRPFLGDVVVSVETAKRLAPRFGNHWDEECLLYVCHGILHLMGYRDSTPKKKAQMDRRQLEVLRKVLGKKWRSKKRKPLF